MKTGHEVAKKTLAHPVIRSLWKPMSITDLNLLWERCKRDRHGGSKIRGWRLASIRELSRKVHKLFNRVRGRRKRQEKDVRAYLRYCDPLVAEETIPKLREKGALRRKIEEVTPCAATAKWIAVFCGAKRYRKKKRYLFEEHTRWIQKGKGGRSVELGVPVCIDQHQFILDHKILWKGIAVDP